MLGHTVISIIPDILAAFAIVISGYFVARLLGYLSKKFLEKISLERFARKIEVSSFLEKIDPLLTLTLVISKLIFYIVFITFIMSAVEVLGMSVMAEAIKSIMLYLPNILAAIFILMFGIFIANSAKALIVQGADEMNIEFSHALGKIIYLIIAVISLSLAIGQLEIGTELLNQVASIILIAVGVALALSLGLGTKELSGLIISGNYVRDLYNPGDKITVGEVSGEVVAVGATKLSSKISKNAR
ncbi:MAG: hypothetical protein IE916_07945 [Epsilonproteobacteria bacterium]|nr:hypothetical protein [Campylobacterota bacterium]